MLWKEHPESRKEDSCRLRMGGAHRRAPAEQPPGGEGTATRAGGRGHRSGRREKGQKGKESRITTKLLLLVAGIYSAKQRPEGKQMRGMYFKHSISE